MSEEKTEWTAGPVLLDTLGRRNRKYADKTCPHCGATFRPRHANSKYCSRPCQWANNKSGHRKSGPIWWTNQRGYIEGKVWDNGQRRQIKQHRYVMEQHLDRTLLPTEDVHHINGDKTDNRIENLRVLDHGEHTRLTNSNRTYVRGKKHKLTDEERARRSAWMKSLHKQGVAMPPQLRRQARGEHD